MPKGEATTNEIMEFLQEHMVTKAEFNQLEVKVDGLDLRVGGLETRVGGLEQKVDGLSQKINQTKLDLLDALDDKIGNLKGDLVILMRKEDKKVDHLIQLLQQKSVITEQDATTLLEIRPFPQSVT